MPSLSEPILIDTAEDHFFLDPLVDKSFFEILKYVKNYHKGKTIIVENNYIDKDFSNEFSNLYSKTFRNRVGYCERLHFFQDVFKDKDDFISKFSENKVTYLGFIVKRPLNVGKVGRSLILPKALNTNYYYLCSIDRDVHLLGKTITVKGFPFIEQDSMVITCAQAAIWMVAKYMHYQHSLPRYLPYDITEKSTSTFGHIGRRLPSSGLTLEQINVGLNNMGFFPIYEYKPRRTDYDCDSKFEIESALWQPVDKIYPYVESGIPVLVCFDKHVCTANGHKIFDDIPANINIDELFNKLKEKGEEHAIISSSVFVDSFLIHDDQQGIYRLLPCNEASFNLLNENHESADLLPSYKLSKNDVKYFPYKTVSDNVDAIIIPLPDKVYLLAEDVFTFAKSLFIDVLIDNLDIQIRKGNKYANELVSSTLFSEKNPVILRTYFIRSVDFKKRIKLNNEINDKVKNYYLLMDLPKFIWVVEISTYVIYSNTRKILGELLFDSTANKYDIHGGYLSIHLPGCFYQNDNIYYEESIIDENIPDEKQYTLLNRYQIYGCTFSRES